MELLSILTVQILSQTELPLNVKGAGQLAAGASQLSGLENLGQVSSGISQLNAAVSKGSNSSAALKDGTQQLEDGLGQLYTQLSALQNSASAASVDRLTTGLRQAKTAWKVPAKE